MEGQVRVCKVCVLPCTKLRSITAKSTEVLFLLEKLYRGIQLIMM